MSTLDWREDALIARAEWTVREYSRPGLRMQLQGRRNELVEIVAMSGGGWMVNAIETTDLMMTLAGVTP